MPRLTPRQAEQAGQDALRIWQGEWNRRIFLLIVLYATVELVLITVFDTGTWDTPLLFAFLGAVSVAMIISHRNWFRRLEADLDKGEIEQVEGPVRFPHRMQTFFTPSLRYVAFVGESRYRLIRTSELLGSDGSLARLEFLSQTRLVISAIRSTGSSE